MKYLSIIFILVLFSCSKEPIVEISMASDQRMHSYNQHVPCELSPSDFVELEDSKVKKAKK